MADNFERVINHLILTESGHKNYRSPTSEGIWGFVNNPFDSGGATIHGVTFKSWKSFVMRYSKHDFFIDLHHDRWEQYLSPHKHGGIYFDLTKFKLNDFKNLTPSDVKFFYFVEYWQRVAGDLLPSGVDYYMFDFAVHSGGQRASEYLQRVIGAVDDGAIGKMTLNKVDEYIQANGVKRLLKELDNERRNFLKQIKNSTKFMKGWNVRLSNVMTKCYELINDVYVEPHKDLTHSRTIKTAKNQVAVATVGGVVATIAPNEKHVTSAVTNIVENLEVANTVTRLISNIYSYGYMALSLVIIGFALYQVYLRYDDWFTGKR